jgi:hypothetical protein
MSSPRFRHEEAASCYGGPWFCTSRAHGCPVKDTFSGCRALLAHGRFRLDMMKRPSVLMQASLQLACCRISRQWDAGDSWLCGSKAICPRAPG